MIYNLKLLNNLEELPKKSYIKLNNYVEVYNNDLKKSFNAPPT